MEMRVEQLSVRAGVPVDTIRYYQSKGLLDPPRRQGRIAWYGADHLERLTRVRALQGRGFSLATISRLLSGELDAADEALLGQLSGLPPSRLDAEPRPDTTPESPAAVEAGGVGAEGGADPGYSLEELAAATGMPLALLKAIEAEGLLIPTRSGGHDRYTEEDVVASRAGLRMLEWGIPLPELLELARRHHEATTSVAKEAVELFSRHIRGPLRHGDRPDALVHPATTSSWAATGDPDVDGLLQAYAELLGAVTTLVGHHFTRTLVRTALDHVEQVGSEEERQAVRTGTGTVAGDANRLAPPPSDRSAVVVDAVSR